jgi:hypothetical protein
VEAYNEVCNNPQLAVVADDASCMRLLHAHVTQLNAIHRTFISVSKSVADYVGIATAFHDMASTYVYNAIIDKLKLHHLLVKRLTGNSLRVLTAAAQFRLYAS